MGTRGGKMVFGADDVVESGAGEEEDSVSGGNMGNGRVLYPLRAMMEDQGPAHLRHPFNDRWKAQAKDEACSGQLVLRRLGNGDFLRRGITLTPHRAIHLIFASRRELDSRYSKSEHWSTGALESPSASGSIMDTKSIL